MTTSLLLSDNHRIAHELAPLAESSGCPLTHLTGADDPRPLWAAAGIVFVDAPRVRSCLSLGLPPHPNVIVLHRENDPRSQWNQYLALGAEQVVAYPEGTRALVKLLDRTQRRSDDARVTAVQGTHSHAGATTLAGLLALARSERGPVLLIDCDTPSGGIDHRLGLADSPGWRWNALLDAAGEMNPERLLQGLPGRGGLHVLSHGPQSSAPPPRLLDSVINAARLSCDAVYLNISHAPDEAALAARDRADTVLLCAGQSRTTAPTARSTLDGIPVQDRVGIVVRKGSDKPDGPHPVWGTVPRIRRVDAQLVRRKLTRGSRRALTAFQKRLSTAVPA
ncbi:septum site-determining protein Ssd [Salininema proteolyticum]|uniref:Septum site-determining protein Ssd n=1 Tax=Salininema proteolyticum TaxID=1607685 RepID=A0ABV8TWJ3_9ACTN